MFHKQNQRNRQNCYSVRERVERERLVSQCRIMMGWSYITWWKKIESGIQLQGTIFGTCQWVGKLGAKRQKEKGSNQDILGSKSRFEGRIGMGQRYCSQSVQRSR